MVKNRYGVTKKQWAKWSKLAQSVFNRVYSVMRRNISLFQHNKAPKVKKEHFMVIAWNCAWIAADAVDGRI